MPVKDAFCGVSLRVLLLFFSTPVAPLPFTHPHRARWPQKSRPGTAMGELLPARRDRGNETGGSPRSPPASRARAPPSPPRSIMYLARSSFYALGRAAPLPPGGEHFVIGRAPSSALADGLSTATTEGPGYEGK